MKTQREAGTKSTKKTKKEHTGLKILAGIIIVILLILAVLPFFINPIVDPIVKQQIKTIFGDNLKIESVHVSFWTGVTIHINHIELRQPNSFGKIDILKADSIKANVALKPLLQNEILIREVTVIRPEIQITQYRNGVTNIAVFLKQFTSNSPSSPGTDFSVHLNQFRIKNGKLSLNSYPLSDNYQPTFVLTNSNISLSNLEFPNPNKAATRFTISGQLGTDHPAPVKVVGTGVFGANKLSFVAKSQVDNLTLTDYQYLMPADMSVTIKSGRAWITSDSRCNNNYINSFQHVTLKDLQLTPKRRSLTGALMGVPANILIKTIEDARNTFSFDFTVNGPLDDIKVNLKLKVFQAIGKGVSAKLGLRKISHDIGNGVKGVGNGVKNVGNKVSDSFKGLFKKK